ncbi:MAG TPA: hypothetical protein VE465_15765 [Streptosporangiaceae bacterium]|jgi:hypothetical protein|nr:hypothetical protein [Streptosporangiaceae bacterium]
MNRLGSFVRFVLSIVVVGILVNLAADFLDTHFPPARNILVYLAALVMACWALTLLTKFALSYFISGRYAVEALVLNSRDELLLYHHPHHKCMLPPGGRVKRTEFPNFALQNRLEERLGLTPNHYLFDPRFHGGLDANSGNLGEIERFAAPFLVQREIHRQRSFVKAHYDFIYVLKLRDDNVPLSPSRYRPVHFVDMAALQEMVAQKRTFPDVLDAYRRISRVAAQERPV